MNPDIPQEVRIVNAIAEQLFDVWPVSIVMIDLEDRIWRVNKQMSDELQLDTDIIGKSVFDLLEVVQDKQNVLPRYLQELREGCQRIIPLSSNCFIYEQKRHISFLIQGALIGVYEEERLVRIVLYYRNVLEERTQKRLLNIALSRTQIFQWSYDLERNLMIIDPRYFEYLGIPTRDYTLTPEEFAYLIHPDDRQSVFDALTLQLDGNLYEAPVEYRLRRDDGSWEWFEAQSTYVGQLKEAPYRIVGICMSTQKYKDTEDCLNEALRKARHSDELKSIFLANMSHEIRTPLNAIVGFSRIIAESTDAEERKSFYDIVEANNERLLQLINEILDLSKIEAGIVEFTITPVRLHSLCREIYDALKFRCPQGVKLIYEPSDEEITIEGDKNRIFQVISNLIGNAFKFTTQGKVSYGYRRKGDGIEFHVSDTGIGIEAGKLDKVFERFVKMNSFAQGTGLGLSICKTIIERLGGTISASSEMGKGTTFTFTLPEKQEETADKHADIHKSGVNAPTYAQKENNASLSGEEHQGSEQPHESSKPGLPTILVAEDTDSNYILVRAIWGKSYHLERARDGMEAVTMFEELHPDLILMDMKMPNLDGLDATKIIRELSPKIPIIALTAYAYECDRQAALKAGCNEFLTKPYKQEELKEVIERHLEEKDVQKQK